MAIHQIKQDGADTFTAMVDPTSGPSDVDALKTAEVIQNVLGLVTGISTTTTADFPAKIQTPAGMTFSGTVGAAINVCVLRSFRTKLRLAGLLERQAQLQRYNDTDKFIGPFSGAIAFTQLPAARKRAIEYNLSKRRMARASKQ